MKNRCPCGSKKPYLTCCGLYVEQQQIPKTPEALMRSRYTAYARNNIDYISATMLDRAAQNFDKEDAKNWTAQVQWLRLKVLRSSVDKQNSHRGYVEFKAYYSWQNKEYCLHEHSEFLFEEGRWFYVGEKTIV